MRQFVFDRPESLRINKSRQQLLEWLLDGPFESLAIRTAVDVGCGVGHFSSYLLQRSLDVVGVDAREENLAEARRRFPSIPFHQADIEVKALRLGNFDFVLCFGLLYHLENPFQAVRNLSSACDLVAVVETQVAPGALPGGRLRREAEGEDQGLTDSVLVPSWSGLVTMLYVAGFDHVYEPRQVAHHEDFASRFGRPSLRRVCVAAKLPISHTQLRLVPRPRTEWDWRTNLITRFPVLRSSRS